MDFHVKHNENKGEIFIYIQPVTYIRDNRIRKHSLHSLLHE